MKRPLILMGLVSILIGSAFVSLVPLAASTPQTTIFVDPATVTVLLYEQFTVDINIADVVNLIGWEFNITFNPNLVECLSVEEGPFLKSAGQVTIPAWRINNTAGYVCALNSIMFGGAPSGSGTLANVTFHCLGKGDTYLTFVYTNLVDSNIDPIPHNTVDGYVEQRWIPEDINGDGIVNIQDILIAALAFGSRPGDPNWNPIADLDNNGIINILDLVTIAIHFGEHV